MNQKLINKVLDQIVSDVLSGDMTAIEVLISQTSEKAALHFLPEDEQTAELLELEGGQP